MSNKSLPEESGELKPDWEKEAKEYSDNFSYSSARKSAFKAGCNHVYETLVKPLQEENKILESLMRSGEQRGHDKAEEHYKSEIAAMNEKIEILNDIDLQNIVNEQQSDLEASYSEVQRLQEQIAALQEENREIKYQIDDLRLTLEVVRHKKREQVNLQTQDLVDQIAALKEENDKIKNDQINSELRMGRIIISKNNEIAALKEENERLKTNLRKI